MNVESELNCPLPHGHFVDYLGFLREDGIWKIVNRNVCA